MINIERPANEPLELTHQRGLAVGTYDTPPIRLAISQSFFDKCYLCEKDSSNFNIEHLKSHQNVNRALKFDWNNLFYCCRNCNSIKSTTYDNILDCCDFTTIITNVISFDMDNQDIEKIAANITTNNNSQQVISTVQLLNFCYAGTTYDTKNVAFETKKYLLDEMNKFKLKIIEHFEYKNLGNAPRAADKLSEITTELGIRKPFVAFKISLIKNNHVLFGALGHLLPTFTPLAILSIIK